MLHAASAHMQNMQLTSQILAFGRICYAIKAIYAIIQYAINSTIFLLNGWNRLVVFEVLCN